MYTFIIYLFFCAIYLFAVVGFTLFFFLNFIERLEILGQYAFKMLFWRKQIKGKSCIWPLIGVHEKAVSTSSAWVRMMPEKFITRSTAGGLTAIWWRSSTYGLKDTNIVSRIQLKLLSLCSHPTTSDYLCRPNSGNPLWSIFKLTNTRLHKT